MTEAEAQAQRSSRRWLWWFAPVVVVFVAGLVWAGLASQPAKAAPTGFILEKVDPCPTAPGAAQAKYVFVLTHDGSLVNTTTIVGGGIRRLREPVDSYSVKITSVAPDGTVAHLGSLGTLRVLAGVTISSVIESSCSPLPN